ncbi:MAG: vWA domain-containing protein, partial [Halobacteria archaeon]|nr:vWA domain-containing protein [Halobacteria archaeon]
MTDKRIELTRRKVLGALGVAGAGAALGGAGTMAFFSDEETYTGNQLQAGSLDMKVDWEEHYSDWSTDENEGLQNEVVMINRVDQDGDGDVDNDDLQAQVPEDYFGLPDPQAPLIAVHQDDVEQFMDNTAIEAYPDANQDGSQDQDVVGDPVFPNEQNICDTASDLDAALTSDLRTDNQDTVEGAPLVNLSDVKPGDFGELTLSFHLCDNPGYVWMWGANFSASENGMNEPESGDSDEVADEVELLDAIQTVLWYDNDGDNLLNGDTGRPICAQLVLDSSGSMTATDGDGVTRQTEMQNGAKQLAQAILNVDATNRVGITEYDSDANVLLSVSSSDSQDQTAIDNAIDSVDASGNTAIDTGINAADDDLGTCPPDMRTVMIVVTDGQNNAGPGPVQNASDSAINDNTDEIFAVGTGGSNQTTLTAIANPDDDAHIELTSDLAAA